MGPDVKAERCEAAVGGDRAAPQTEERPLSRIARVVPDLATFAVDDGFSYRVGSKLDVEVGSIVRIPLGSRRVGGRVVHLRDGDDTGLKEVIGVSGAMPTFDNALLQTLRWAAIHYVAPLSVLLRKSAAPNLPRTVGGKWQMQAEPHYQDQTSLAAGKTVFLTGTGPWHVEVASLIRSLSYDNKNVLVVLPTQVEADALFTELPGDIRRRCWGAWPGRSAAVRTTAWSYMRSVPGSVVIGTPETSLWPMASPGAAVVVGESRRGMKNRQTPTVNVRDVLRKRATVERMSFVAMGQVPSLELIASGVSVKDARKRVWPLVEVLDRSTEPPSSAPVSEALLGAIAGVAKRQQPVFVFVSRRGYAPAMRCIGCGNLRRCVHCHSTPGRGATCERCGTDAGPCIECSGSRFMPIGAAVGRIVQDLQRSIAGEVTASGEGGLVQVGTERDIPPVASQALVAITDIDSMLLRPHFRAEEQALNIGARLATSVARASGLRMVIQTYTPNSRVIEALRRGHPMDFLETEMTERVSQQLPPVGELLALEVTGSGQEVDRDLRRIIDPSTALFGPGPVDSGNRWLFQAPDLRLSKVQLRHLVQSWRDQGRTVRVDADPIEA